jgi:hypothetical protein
MGGQALLDVQELLLHNHENQTIRSQNEIH